jgi:hypothetical protein
LTGFDDDLLCFSEFNGLGGRDSRFNIREFDLFGGAVFSRWGSQFGLPGAEAFTDVPLTATELILELLFRLIL